MDNIKNRSEKLQPKYDCIFLEEREQLYSLFLQNWSSARLQMTCDLACKSCHPLKVLECYQLNKHNLEAKEEFIPKNPTDLRLFVEAIRKTRKLYYILNSINTRMSSNE